MLASEGAIDAWMGVVEMLEQRLVKRDEAERVTRTMLG